MKMLLTSRLECLLLDYINGNPMPNMQKIGFTTSLDEEII